MRDDACLAFLARIYWEGLTISGSSISRPFISKTGAMVSCSTTSSPYAPRTLQRLEISDLLVILLFTEGLPTRYTIKSPPGTKALFMFTAILSTSLLGDWQLYCNAWERMATS